MLRRYGASLADVRARAAYRSPGPAVSAEDKVRDAARGQAQAAIAELRREEAEAGAQGDTETAALRREQRLHLERFDARLSALDGDSMTRDKTSKWTALARAHRATGKPRPSQLEVAKKMGWDSEQPLRDYCRELGIKNWHDVHSIVAAFRENL